MADTPIDDMDRQLIDMLSRDARISNRKIALALNVTEGTVRGRIKRLQQDGLLSFTAITSFDLGTANKLAFVGVQADIGSLRQIADTIATIPEVTSVLITMGRFNILAICLFDELADLHAVASDQILALAGVHHVETSVAVKTVKYNSRIVRITDRQQPNGAD
ncbi:Lrp/AsnC family transcriptional regulator [Sphingopyxis lindanitolerans]|uniref:Lrp/AsnC family transcriptional regulator n=1 Tax=Sphingopyxis lindanitolerans TaxID=2054227 RepID=A0A2S8B6S1_9SPHN|nr:Lrp/AsnC family transcriptional regulator [Sphingopyxis lindanitolerans]PQM28030.1 Lrp/AsnC family transcriptional regulator [Sphingopyxis lindanitolerans]